MSVNPTPSFRRVLTDALAAYGERGGPIHFEGKSEPYTRAIVSAFNTANGTAYSVIKTGGGLLVGLRSDCRNYSPVSVAQPPKGPDYSELSGIDLLGLAVERMRREALGGDEMRAALAGLLTENDDLI